jgi:hypothetical protein
MFRKLQSNHSGFGDRASLLRELSGIAGKAHSPQALKGSAEKPEKIRPSSQAGGWTLEALLGIPRNSLSAPDKCGYEIKSVGGSKVSLITTEPDYGYRQSHGLQSYLEKFGRTGTANPAQQVFSGVHSFGVVNKATNCVLKITHWDSMNHSPDGSGEPCIELVHVPTETIVSGWSFKKIGAAWAKKHAGAVYVQTRRQEALEGVNYVFGPHALFCEGTSALDFFGGVSKGLIQLDPGDRYSPAQGAKKRTQWRIQGAIPGLLGIRLSELYRQVAGETIGDR